MIFDNAGKRANRDVQTLPSFYHPDRKDTFPIPGRQLPLRPEVFYAHAEWNDGNFVQRKMFPNPPLGVRANRDEMGGTPQGAPEKESLGQRMEIGRAHV